MFIVKIVGMQCDGCGAKVFFRGGASFANWRVYKPDMSEGYVLMDDYTGDDSLDTQSPTFCPECAKAMRL
jgi:hypothetical protein